MITAKINSADGGYQFKSLEEPAPSMVELPVLRNLAAWDYLALGGDPEDVESGMFQIMRRYQLIGQENGHFIYQELVD